MESGYECHLLTRGTQADRVEGTVFVSVRLDRTGESRSNYLHGHPERRARKGSGCHASDRDGVHELGTRSIRVGLGGSSRGRSAIVQEEDPRRRPDGMVVHDHASRCQRRVRDRQRQYLHDHQDQSWREISQVDRGSRIGQEDAMDRDGTFGQWTTRVRVGTSLEKRVSHGGSTHGRGRATTPRERGTQVLQDRRRRIAFELLHQLGVHESRRELRTSLRIDASTAPRVFECGTKYRDGESSDGFTEGGPLQLVGTLLRTSSRPISTAAHRRDRHYRDASGREHRRASELCIGRDQRDTSFQV